MATITDFIIQQNLQNSLDRQLNNQPEYIPTGQGLNVGSIGITPALLRGTGLQMGSMGIDPRLLNYISSPVLTDASLQIGSIGSPYSRRLNTGIPSAYNPEVDLNISSAPFLYSNVEDDDIESQTIPEFQEGQLNQSGIAKLFQFISNFSPLGLVKRGLESLRGFNNRIQQSDFGQSRTLMDYLDARKYGGRRARDDARARTMAQTRGIQKKIDRGEFNRDTSGITDRGRGNRTFSTKTSAPKKSSSTYDDAKRAFRS